MKDHFRGLGALGRCEEDQQLQSNQFEIPITEKDNDFSDHNRLEEEEEDENYLAHRSAKEQAYRSHEGYRPRSQAEQGKRQLQMRY